MHSSHTRPHTHAHTHTRAHQHMHAHTNMCARSCALIRAHTSTCTRTHTLTRARAHSCTRTLTCTPVRTHAHTCVLGGARCCWPGVSAALGGVERPLGAAFVCVFPAAHGLDHLPGAHSPSDLSFSEVSARALSAHAGPPSRRGARERVRVPVAAPRGSCDLDAPPPRPTGLHSLTSAFPSPHAPNRVEIQFARVASDVSLSRRCCQPREFGQNRLVCRKNGSEPMLAVYTRGERRPFSDQIGTTRPRDAVCIQSPGEPPGVAGQCPTQDEVSRPFPGADRPGAASEPPSGSRTHEVTEVTV